MKIAIGNDRKGIEYKNKLVDWLIECGHEVTDVGSNSDEPVDYPIYAYQVGKMVSSGDCERGILICSTGIGMSVASNKIKGIRCGLAYNSVVAKRMREHNDANVIAFGQDFISYDMVKECVSRFIDTEFLGIHHELRIRQIEMIENNIFENRGERK